MPTREDIQKEEEDLNREIRELCKLLKKFKFSFVFALMPNDGKDKSCYVNACATSPKQIERMLGDIKHKAVESYRTNKSLEEVDSITPMGSSSNPVLRELLQSMRDAITNPDREGEDYD